MLSTGSRLVGCRGKGLIVAMWWVTRVTTYLPSIVVRAPHFTSPRPFFSCRPSSVDKTVSDDGGNRITGSRRVPRDCREICEFNVKSDRNVMVVNRITRRRALNWFDGNIVCIADYNRPIVTLQIVYSCFPNKHFLNFKQTTYYNYSILITSYWPHITFVL